MPTLTYHNHHIVPRHMGGSDDPSNLIRLTIAGHAFAHWCLWMKFGRLPDKCAWLLLSGKTDEGELLIQELARQAQRSPEGRAKMVRMGNKNSVGKRSIETRAKMSKNKNHLGHKHSPETKAKLSAAKMGNKNHLGYRHPRTYEGAGNNPAPLASTSQV